MQVVRKTKRMEVVKGIRIVKTDYDYDDGFQEEVISPVFIDDPDGFTMLGQADEWIKKNREVFAKMCPYVAIPPFSEQIPRIYPQFTVETVDVQVPVYDENAEEVSVSPDMQTEMKKALQIAEKAANDGDPGGYRMDHSEE